MGTAEADVERSIKHREGPFPERLAKVRGHGNQSGIRAVHQQVHLILFRLHLLHKVLHRGVITLIQRANLHNADFGSGSRLFCKSLQCLLIPCSRVHRASFFLRKHQGNSTPKPARSSCDNANFIVFHITFFVQMVSVINKLRHAECSRSGQYRLDDFPGRQQRDK